MNGKTVFNSKQIKPGNFRFDVRLTDDIMSDDVIDYYVIAKSSKNDQSFKIDSEKGMSPGVMIFPLAYLLIGKLINRHQG